MLFRSPAARAPGAHLLPGQLMAIRQAIGMSKGKPAGLAYLKEFVEDIKASGLVAREIEVEGLKDASVSARAQKMEMRARSLDLHSATIS